MNATSSAVERDTVVETGIPQPAGDGEQVLGRRAGGRREVFYGLTGVVEAGDPAVDEPTDDVIQPHPVGQGGKQRHVARRETHQRAKRVVADVHPDDDPCRPAQAPMG